MCTTKKDMSFVTDFPLHTYPGYVQQQFPPILHKTFARIFLTFYQKHSKLSQLNTHQTKFYKIYVFFSFFSLSPAQLFQNKSGILKRRHSNNWPFIWTFFLFTRICEDKRFVWLVNTTFKNKSNHFLPAVALFDFNSQQMFKKLN